MDEIRKAYTILVRISEGKRPLERQRHRLELNTKMYFEEIQPEDLNWFQLA
jgi:hypothetical protein